MGRNFAVVGGTQDYRVAKLLLVQPRAVDLRAAGHCDVCRARNTLVFYSLLGLSRDFWYMATNAKRADHEALGNNLWIDPDRVSGGYYCAACGFSNAGAMLRRDYELAEILSVD
jgi:hypothetical protein